MGKLSKLFKFGSGSYQCYGLLLLLLCCCICSSICCPSVFKVFHWFEGYEQFNNYSGINCYSCENKNPNECLMCFNCGFGVDENGNGRCLAGTKEGPANNESVSVWYHRDPFERNRERNDIEMYKKRNCSTNRLLTV